MSNIDHVLFKASTITRKPSKISNGYLIKKSIIPVVFPRGCTGACAPIEIKRGRDKWRRKEKGGSEREKKIIRPLPHPVTGILSCIQLIELYQSPLPKL